MKASVKFREEEQKKPVVRAKVPLSVVGIPLQSGVVAGGESKELTLSLSTLFESGPSIKIAYRPNDTWNPFSLVVRTGTGPFGSPISSSLLMSAEFNLLGGGKGNPNPSFMLHFKPRFGDFSVKKSQSSDRLGEVVDVPGVETGFYGRKITVLPPAAAGALKGMEVAARTKLPVRSCAVVNFRWGLRFTGAGGDSIGGIDLRRIPFLVMNKIGIEHVGGSDGGSDSKGKEKSEQGNGEIGDMCLMMKRQLEGLQSENGMLRKAVDDLRQDMNAGRWGLPMSAGECDSAGYGDGGERSGGKTEKRSGREKRSNEGDVNEELKKALKGAGVSCFH